MKCRHPSTYTPSGYGAPSGPSDLAATIDTVLDTTTCDTLSLDVDATGGFPPYSYAWLANSRTPGFSSLTAESPTWAPQDIGNAMLTCQVTDSIGNTVLAAQAINIGPVFLADVPFLTGGALV